ncbi:MAG: Asd/ArgC dimerization domain-containing protein [Candidatus Acidiferrales bacterium]
MSTRPAPAPCQVVIAGASSLRGRELKQVFEDRHFPATDYDLLDESIAAGTLTEAGGEPAVVRAFDEQSFDGAQFVFFAGNREDARVFAPAAIRAGAKIIDLTGGLRGEPAAIAWIPALDRFFPPANISHPCETRIFLSPPPPVQICATLCAAFHDFSPRRMTVLFLRPVSECGQPGVDELEAQTAQLLSLKPASQDVFGAQVAFNLLSAYGEQCRPSLQESRAEIVADTRDFLAGRCAVPAIQLLHAPAFYGFLFSAFVEFPTAIKVEALDAALAAAGVQLVASDDPQPDNVTLAGESKIQLARIERDASVENAFWLWGGVDNLRFAVTNAVQVAEALLAS